MSWIDWSVLMFCMIGIVLYGLYKGRGSTNMDQYFGGGKNTRWFTIGLSIMATQASAITFLSAPGQAFTDGMRFVQFYFGLPIAMVLIAWLMVPMYKKLKVRTAYEYLGKRFDNKTRLLGAFLFLTQRGLAAGFTIYAPALVLSSILGWNIYLTNLLIGITVIIYTVSGGTKAVSHTHKLQMLIILSGMLLAGFLIFDKIPYTFNESLSVGGALGRMNVLDTSFDPQSKYNLWSGLLGGLFLALSYFGTDQSQVQRYLGRQSAAQSRIGLLFNGLVKIPMQFLILLLGVLVFVFYQFNKPPIYFNETAYENAALVDSSKKLQAYELRYDNLHNQKKEALEAYLDAPETASGQNYLEEARKLQKEADETKSEMVGHLQELNPLAEDDDVNYIFLTFVLDEFPVGLIGLLLACILFASMSSTSGELNALASTTMVDVYRNLKKKELSEAHYLSASKWFTAAWGVYAILFAFFAGTLGSLIEAVNVLGSLFYGTILGIFLCGFLLKRANTNLVFISSAITQVLVIIIYLFELSAYLWLPMIGSLLVFITCWIGTLFKR